MKNLHMNLNNGDNRQNIQISSDHHKTSFLLIVTIVEIHVLILDVSVNQKASIQNTFYVMIKKWVSDCHNISRLLCIYTYIKHLKLTYTEIILMMINSSSTSNQVYLIRFFASNFCYNNCALETHSYSSQKKTDIIKWRVTSQLKQTSPQWWLQTLLFSIKH